VRLPATRLLARTFAVTGVDFSAVQIERARALVPKAKFLCLDILEHDFAPESFAGIVSFYAVIHMPMDEQPGLFMKFGRLLRPGGCLMAIVGYEAWTGTDDRYLDVEGGHMYWSHPDEATYLRWIGDAGLQVHWTRFIPEGQSGHSLVFAHKPPLSAAPPISG
jgi:SAM-dependent methyltransferase